MLIAACASAPPTSTLLGSAVVRATPPTTRTDNGPVDAVTSVFQAAQAGGMLQQLEFLACVTGGADATQFSVLLGNLDVLALASSGIDPDDYWGALGTSFDEFDATEISRAAVEARVSVRFKMKTDPDIARLREIMR